MACRSGRRRDGVLAMAAVASRRAASAIDAWTLLWPSPWRRAAQHALHAAAAASCPQPPWPRPRPLRLRLPPAAPVSRRALSRMRYYDLVTEGAQYQRAPHQTADPAAAAVATAPFAFPATDTIPITSPATEAGEGDADAHADPGAAHAAGAKADAAVASALASPTMAADPATLDQLERELQSALESQAPDPTLMPPEPPTNCCMSGCAHCVWDIYQDEMDEYLKQREQRQLTAGNGGSGGSSNSNDHGHGLPGGGDGGAASPDPEAEIDPGIKAFRELEKRLNA
ncbi:hypothetical protein CXG81DRAFT_19401 [Caulochytrium protostelioides]|uniref:Oxidoreductase-like domain-containing protein n=1 Tax=Caulochytrium protostelioides TaxID=1555241 RepID=A0A4P9X682_9FUNG|nr:hypothetical protein CXG81DRAFT_19401 [Caulochytrium protostelioides]|eukprot:RKP00675.1 hypothetical protein CXG81DRAFT_19401 [Caulochytrium protostelioides]